MKKTDETILSVRGLTTRLSLASGTVTIVEDLSFDLKAGKTLAVVGESGCGKSMTALSVMRLLPHPPALPCQGEVLFEGHDLLTLPEKAMRKIRGKKIAMIFQDPMSALNPVYTIGSQLSEVGELHLNLSSKAAYQLAAEALDSVGIPDPRLRLGEYPHQLSGGMKQRVMIAMALLCEPDILIADEPTTALDVTVQKQVLDLIRDLQKKKGTALFLITHDMSVVAEMADEVVVMYASQAVEHGDVFSVFDKRAHPYTEGLFNSRPQAKRCKEKLSTIQGFVPQASHYPSGCHFHPRCPYVMDICKSGDVPSFEIGEDHNALCWLHDPKLKKSEIQ